MDNTHWPDPTRPLGLFVLQMRGLAKNIDPMVKRRWKVAWDQKSKWYRSRTDNARLTSFGARKGEIYEAWLALGDEYWERQ